MKNTLKVFGIIAIVAVIGLSMAACENDPDTDAFAGTWLATDEYGSTKIVASNGTWTMSQTDEGSQTYYDGMKGTYTISGNKVNAVVTHVNESMYWNRQGARPNGWVAIADLPAEVLAGFSEMTTMQFNITGNQFTANGATFTKQ